jgi:hypothetical protein
MSTNSSRARNHPHANASVIGVKPLQTSPFGHDVAWWRRGMDLDRDN